MAVLAGKVYVLGGFDGAQRHNSMEAYDPFHNSWTEVWFNWVMTSYRLALMLAVRN